jgi:hypothetical protein
MEMVKRFVVILLLVLLTACGGEKDPVIGVQTLTSQKDSKTVVRMHYFESKKDAMEFYRNKGIYEYALMIHPELDEKKFYEDIDIEETEGMKEAEFKDINASRSLESAFTYLYEEMGLGIDCAFNGKECK